MGKQIYDKPTWQLLEDFVATKDKENFTKKDIVGWFRQNHPKIKENTVNCHIISCSVNDHNRRHYSVKKDILFRLPDGKYKKYDSLSDGIWNGDGMQNSEINIEKEQDSEGIEQEKELLILQGKVLEKHIEEFVKDNLKFLELELYNDEENSRTGQQFDTFDIGRIDLLCLDKKKNFVVIELKEGRESDRVVGQILRYIGWVKENLCESGQSVNGIIISNSEEENRKLSFSLKPVSDLIKQKLIKIDIQFMDKLELEE